jgi:hypothetical protein
MYRKLLVVVALMGAARSAAVAQTCMGLASYTSGPVQVAGHGSAVPDFGAYQVGSSIGYGRPGGVFADAAIARTSADGTDASLGFAVDAGYQVQVGQAQFCPVAAVGLSNGPDTDGMGVNGSTRSATVGLALGTAINTRQVQFVPTAGFTLEYSHRKLQDAFTSGSSSDAYGVAHMGVGLVFNSVSLRPSLDIPVGLEGADPALGLTVGLNFGGKR